MLPEKWYIETSEFSSDDKIILKEWVQRESNEYSHWITYEFIGFSKDGFYKGFNATSENNPTNGLFKNHTKISFSELMLYIKGEPTYEVY